MPSPRPVASERLQVKLTPQEMKLLDDYCAENEKTKTEVVRELIRTLKVKG